MTERAATQGTPYDLARDTQWRAGLRAGQLAVFDAIYLALVPSLYAFAQRFVAADIAEDVVQDVMIDVWERRETIVMQGTMRAYLFGAVRRRIADVRRRQGVAERHADIMMPPGTIPLPDDAAEADELERATQQALATLSDRSRLILTLRWYDGLSYPEIAEALGMSVEAAKKQGRRMEQTIRELLARFMEQSP